MSTKRKLPATLAQPAVRKSAKPITKARIDESRTSVSVADPLQPGSSGAVEAIEISSDSESNYDDLDLDEDESSEKENETKKQTQINGTLRRTQQPTPDDSSRLNHGSKDVDTDMLSPALHKEGSQDLDASDEEAAAPTFGDLIRNHETIDVPSSLAVQQSTPAGNGLAAQNSRAIAPPSLSSLGTVLTQALRTDDTDLLESCLHITDTPTLQNTIERLDSSLAGTLLTKLAARIHRRPGRAHSLMGWVQWTLAAHGGALAALPDVHERLIDLNRVLEERARGLNSLLALKGKLDMLEAQMTLRRANRLRGVGRRRRTESEDDGESEEESDEEGIVYVEGQEDEPSDLANGALVARRRDEEDDEFPVVNGVDTGSDDESEDEDQPELDVDDDDVDEESLDEDEVDHDDIEESGEEDESDAEAAAPPPKVQKKTTSAFSKRR